MTQIANDLGNNAFAARPRCDNGEKKTLNKQPLTVQPERYIILATQFWGILKGDNNVQDMWMQVGKNSEKADKGKEQKQT